MFVSSNSSCVVITVAGLSPESSRTRVSPDSLTDGTVSPAQSDVCGHEKTSRVSSMSELLKTPMSASLQSPRSQILKTAASYTAMVEAETHLQESEKESSSLTRSGEVLPLRSDVATSPSSSALMVIRKVPSSKILNNEESVGKPAETPEKQASSKVSPQTFPESGNAQDTLYC